MSNYFNTLSLREKLEQLGKCRFMEASEFADGVDALKGKKIVIVGCGAQGLNQGLNLRDSGLDLPIYWGNRNWHPMLADTLQQMADDGVGRALVERAEQEAWHQERAWMRLEVRKDNTASIGLFESMGYRRFGSRPGYYGDLMDAWRYEKTLRPASGIDLLPIPYYRQSLDFTCGPAALMMAMHTLDPRIVPSRKLELRLWREATTIFHTGSGDTLPSSVY